ncbi:nuclear transport factor 2 family protein [Ideonella sp. BN130291]|uniref:nuclear transport factor 2 family protein n=1 Tax=Ideonella sp. BN130291 TaxID=3112940 RepID=UPI002E260E0A|nr:nuclear transport factor 2 family protein [Ideonella sp. BN130291]
MAGTEVVRALWALFQARRWQDARALFADDAVCHWWSSGEQFTGADAIIHVNAIYPEGWQIHLIEVNALADGRVHSIVRVTLQDGPTVFANSLFRLRDGLITAVDEYWSTIEAPPAWRSEGRLPGWRQLPQDTRGSVPTVQ